MIIRFKHLLLPSLILMFLACKNEHTNSYAIKDFRKSIQPFLYGVVSKGIVTSHDSAEISVITDDELLLLSKCESQVLRATAFVEMRRRDHFNQFDFVMSHLDDTAIIAVDNGEFGIVFKTVSDRIIQGTSWGSLELKNKTIEKVLTKHNYLRSAYIILEQLEAQEKYYPFIKDMATRPRQLDKYENIELRFDDIEFALYGLAKFRKKEDVQLIKGKLLKNVWWLSDLSFQLMTEFPDTAYFDVLKEYHDGRFYKFSGNRPHGFSGVVADRAAPEDFIKALVVQQTERSAKLLDTMLYYLPKFTCMPDKQHIIEEVIHQVWEHPCAAYTALREKIRPRAKQVANKRMVFPIDLDPLPIDTTKKKYYWYD
jgi:hypothetical protein